MMNEAWTTDPAICGGNTFEASRRLWPDPFEAPGVPPAEVLLRLAEHPHEDRDLVDQVSASMEGRRALFAALASQNLGLLVPRSKPLRPIATGLKSQVCGEMPVFGEIWHTRTVVEHFDGEKIVARRNWIPPMALVVSEPQNVGFDTICRVVLCSVREICNEEIIECGGTVIFQDTDGFDYAAHLELEYPLSCSQLATRVGTVSLGDLTPLQDALAEISVAGDGAGYLKPLSSRGTTIYLRLAAIATWLSANADARLLLHESNAEADAEIKDVFEGWDVITARLSALENDLALAAAGGQRWTTLLKIRGPIQNLAAVLQGPAEVATTRVAMNDFPVAQQDGSASGQWEISDATLPAQPLEFFLVHRQTGVILGAGHLQDGRFLELKNADKAALENCTDTDFLLLLVLPPPHEAP